MSDARRLIARAKFNQRVTIGQWGTLQGEWLTLFEDKTAFQHFRSPRLKTVPRILFQASCGNNCFAKAEGSSKGIFQRCFFAQFWAK